MAIFFTSDTHFGHRRILEFGRGERFLDINHHDLGLISLWNRVVGPKDTVYHLGDLSFHKREQTAEILQRLNGQIHVIKGNHDRSGDLNAFLGAGLIASWDRMKSLSVVTSPDEPNVKKTKQPLVLCHFPLLTWDQAHRGTWHLHGHCHGNLVAPETTRLDVGVDAWDFAPVSFDQVAAVLSTRTFTGVDHHA